MKKVKAEAKAFAALANKLLEKEIREEDLLSDPDKVEQYTQILNESLDKIYGDSDRISDEETIEKKVDEILYYYRLLKFRCVDREKFYELLGLWRPHVPEKLKEMGQWETFLELNEQYEELEDLRLNEDALYDLLGRLRKCEDESCGKWFVQTAKNKRFCNRRCAARSKQRLKRKEDPEAFRKYHRDDYQKRKKKKGGA